MKLSVVVPVYGCPEAVQPLCERVATTAKKITEDYEIILVNDACPKGSWLEVEKACARDDRVMGIEMARNFGQIRAITAGLDYASGDWIVVMDCDLQDRPEGILDLYNKAQEGYDVVFARRKDRKDTKLVKWLSKTFYKVYDYFTDGHYDNSICNFSISRREVIDQYRRMREQNRAYTLFLKWIGFRQTAIDIESDERFAGKSSYNFKRKISMAAQFITAQSNKPLLVSIRLGVILAVLSILYAVWQILKYFFTDHVITGWTSMIVSMYFLGGIMLIFMGVLGLYIGYVFNEVKQRPLYIVRTVLNPSNERNGEGPKEQADTNFSRGL